MTERKAARASRGRDGVRLLATAALLCVLLGAGHFAPRASEAAQGGRRAKTRRVSPRAVFMRHCARCHGRDGKAKTSLGDIYAATDLTDADWWRREQPNNFRLRRVIAQGAGAMPGFADRLSAAEINALVPFVRNFKGR
jgi:mono/diheme cytochrome c family protein